MQSPPALQFREIAVSSRRSSQLETALRMSAALGALNAHYSELLRVMIFPNPRLGYDRKELIRHKKCLCDDEAHQVLQVVWKKSSFVTEEALARVGLRRVFEDCSLNAYNLATKLANSPDHVAKINSRIRGIGIAAEAFGLIERDNNRRTKKPLQGTELLHQFMLRLSDNHYRQLTDLIPFLPLTGPDSDLPNQ